jgi:hypothetical protein
MKRIQILCFLMLLLSWGLVLTLTAEELPFGIQAGWQIDSVLTPGFDSLKNNLGINTLYATSATSDTAYNIPYSKIYELHDTYGFDVIPYMSDVSDTSQITTYFQNYLKAHYFIIGAGDDTSGTRFYARNGQWDSSDPNWYCSMSTDTTNTDSSFLDKLYYLHEWNFYDEQVIYQPILYMRLIGDSTQHVPVAIFNVYISNGDWGADPLAHPDSILIRSQTIWADDFISTNPNSVYLPLIANDTACNWCGNYLIYQIKTTHQRAFAVKWLKVYNDNGRQLVEDTTQYATFRRYAQTHQDVFAWQLRDDMKTDEIMPARKIDSLISVGTGDAKRGMMKWYRGFIIEPRDLLKIGKPKRFWMDPYPFRGDAFGDWQTLYYGSDANTEGWGLQLALNDLCDFYIAPAKAAIQAAAGEDTTELWYMAQMQLEVDTTGLIRHRWPTGPEMRCEMALALSYGVNAIQYWPYVSQGEADDTGDFGLYYAKINGDRGSLNTDVWNRIAQYVTPNFQAIDEYLADSYMVWERSYNSFQTERFNYISSIHGWSDSPNPDTGWAQIGEFHNGNDKYVMLVNRSCNMEGGSEAPPQHFTIRFNAGALNLGDYVLITDLADTVVDSSSQWVGIPRTTYSAVMPDGKIPYTITLRAGEGKLIKIAKTGRQKHNKRHR